MVHNSSPGRNSTCRPPQDRNVSGLGVHSRALPFRRGRVNSCWARRCVPDGDESPRLGFEHCRTKRSTSLRRDIGQRESDDKLHTITSRYHGLLLASRSTDGPRRKVKGRSGRDAGFHDGSESFNASRFFVTMASPFFVDMSMPVAQTARHSSRHSHSLE